MVEWGDYVRARSGELSDRKQLRLKWRARALESCQQLAAMAEREYKALTLQCKKRATMKTRMRISLYKSNSARALKLNSSVGTAKRTK